MTKVLVEIDDNGKLVKGDMLIFDGKKFKAVRKDHVLSDIPKIYEKLAELNIEIGRLYNEIKYDRGLITEEEHEELCGLNK